MSCDTISDTDRISSALRYIDPTERDRWLRMGMAIKSALGEPGFDLWDRWGQAAHNYDVASSKTVWKSINPDGNITIGSLFYEAKRFGWQDNPKRISLSADEFERCCRALRERAQADAAKMKRERAETAQKAQAILAAASSACADNDYLVRKQLLPTDTLREIEAADVARILGYVPKSSNEPLVGRLLVVPVTQGDALSTVELIDGQGRKAALAGRGSKAEGYWATKLLPDEVDVLLLGEGMATTLSASVSTGYLGIAALASGNLRSVAKLMRARYKGAEIVILADLVKITGLPDSKAVNAAQEIGGKLAIPDFGSVRDPGQKDFNDLYVAQGAEAVKRAIARASAPIRAEVEKPVAVDSNVWPRLFPLTNKLEPDPYPIDALPIVIREAVEEVQGFVKAPLPLVVSSALAALSLASQAHIDVKRAEKLQGPVALFLLTIADSGERKSTCDGFFIKPIRDYEAAQAEAAKPMLKDYEAAAAAWTAKCSGVTEKIRQLAKDKKPTEEMEAELRVLKHERPEHPRVPRMIYSDITPEALGYKLAKVWPSAGIVSSEAGIVLGSHGMSSDSGMRNMATLNLLWDGAEISSERRTTESWSARGARLTVALQVQEPTLRDFFKKQGALARGTGFLARFFFAWPESTQGTRSFTEAPAHWPKLAAFHKRIAAILEKPAPINEDGALEPLVVSLSPKAKGAWVEFHDAIETELKSGGELYDVRDIASKSADNAARLAALFQMFEQESGAVSCNAFEGACRIAAWHLAEARRFFEELTVASELTDAVRLDGWLMKFCGQSSINRISKNSLLQRGPLRKVEVLDNVLGELSELGRIRLVTDGKQKVVEVNPALLREVA